jgi:hypothetical protein
MEKKLIIYRLVKVTAGGRHGWYETNLGYNIRKPLGTIKGVDKE